MSFFFNARRSSLLNFRRWPGLRGCKGRDTAGLAGQGQQHRAR